MAESRFTWIVPATPDGAAAQEIGGVFKNQNGLKNRVDKSRQDHLGAIFKNQRGAPHKLGKPSGP